MRASRLREFYSYLSLLRIILKSDKFDIDFSFKNPWSRGNRMKVRRDQDEGIKGKIAGALRAAVDKSPENVEGVAAKLKISTATLYKYMNGDMIPGGQILWRACEHLPIVLDKDGLHPPRRSRSPKALKDEAQYVLPFLNESVDGEKVNCHVRRKDNQYVQVNLRIKLAG
jgi:hypothetical protein